MVTRGVCVCVYIHICILCILMYIYVVLVLGLSGDVAEWKKERGSDKEQGQR